MAFSNDKTAIVILAAGASSRIGSPKQLLLHKGKTLIKHTVDEAVNSNAAAVVVVVGANAASFLNEIDQNKITVVENKEWKDGMASSIIVGLKEVLKQLPQVDGIIITVCDQPFIATTVFDNLISTYQQTGKPIIVSDYGAAIGPPSFFHQSFFNELMQLKGDEGAKKIVQQHKDEVETISFPQGNIDIDWKKDYELLTKE